MKPKDCCKMPPDGVIIQMVRAEISKILEQSKNNIMSVMLKFRKEGKRVYQILREQCFITKFFVPQLFIGTYPYTEEKRVAIYVGANNQDDIYFQFIDMNDKKNV